jgi:hypothetical protein
VGRSESGELLDNAEGQAGEEAAAEHEAGGALHLARVGPADSA